MAASRFVPLLILCCLLAACQSLKEENKQAFKKIETWKGQNIQIALDTFGPPDKMTTGSKGHYYFWHKSREYSRALTAPTLTNVDGKNVTYNPNSPGFTGISSCILRITTDPNNIILHYRYKGHSLGCQVFAKQIGAADEPADDKDNSAPGDASKDGKASQ